MLIVLPSCGEKVEQETIQKTERAQLLAENLITAEDVRGIVSYEPSVSVKNTGSKSTVRYDSEPIGQDPVIVELYSYSDLKNVSEIHDEFKQRKEKRPKAQDVTDLGIEAYIAYPSINLYRDGYMAVITAGSGGDETQNEILKKAAGIAAAHLDEYLKQYPS